MKNKFLSFILLSCAATSMFAMEKTTTHGAQSQQQQVALDFELMDEVGREKNPDLRHISTLLAGRAHVNCLWYENYNGVFETVSPLHNAARKTIVPLIKLLLENGAHVNQRNNYTQMRTPLHYAITKREDAPQAIQLLLDHGADITLQDKFGETPLDCAKRTAPHLYKLLKAPLQKQLEPFMPVSPLVDIVIDYL